MSALAIPAISAISAISAMSARPALPAFTRVTPMLWRSLLLALLLHLWLLLLGSAPGGGAHLGQGVWGAIDITLRAPPTPAASASVLPATPPQAGPPGAATVLRTGGAARANEPAPQAEPGAAQERTAPALLPLAPAPVLLPPLSALPATPPAAPLALPAPVPGLQGGPAAAERQLNSPLARPAPEIRPLAETAPLPGAEPLPTTLPAPASLAAPALAEPPLRQLSAPPSPLETTPAAQPAPALAPVPPATAAPPAPGPAATAGVPDGAALDAGPGVGHVVAPPPAAAASAPPRLNLELARPRGGALSRGAATGLLPLLPRPLEKMEKLGRDIQNAAKPDCRDAHAGWGLLAAVPLAVDALRKEGGCKW